MAHLSPIYSTTPSITTRARSAHASAVNSPTTTSYYVEHLQSVLKEMLQYQQPSAPEASTVLDRQRARVKWLLQQQQQLSAYSMYYTGDDQCRGDEYFLRDLGNGWPDLAAAGYNTGPGHVEVAGGGGAAPPVGGGSTSVKRKAEEGTREVMDSSGAKRRKKEGETKMEASDHSDGGSSRKEEEEEGGPTAREGSKKAAAAAPPPKQDYIHVRARRGQATDSHSLAERVRREKISERMKYLQELVPGCSKITGKAGMLDEIINYVQSLQRQVEFLSMKLAAVNPRIDFNIDHFFSAKEAAPSSNTSFPMVGISSEITEPACYFQFNQLQQANAYYGLDMSMNAPELTPCPTTSAAMSDAACLNANGSSFPWETNIQSSCNVEIDQEKGFIFPFQLLQGNAAPNNPKMEL